MQTTENINLLMTLYIIHSQIGVTHAVVMIVHISDYQYLIRIYLLIYFYTKYSWKQY